MKIAWTSCTNPRFSRKLPEINKINTNRFFISCSCKIKQQFTLKHHALLRSKKIQNDLKTSIMHNFMDNAPFHSNFIPEWSPIKDLYKYHDEFKNNWTRNLTSLKNRTFELHYPRLVMAQISSIMLMEMISEELDAPARVNPAQFATSIETSSFMYGQIWHELLQVHVQFASKTLPDHESIIRNGFCVKNCKFLMREKFWFILESRSENCS